MDNKRKLGNSSSVEYPEELFRELSQLEEVEAIALGGSRAGTAYDEKSDYDVYVYVTRAVAEEKRKELLSNYCSYMEIGNHFWETEDNCTLNSGIDIDILYRSLADFCEGIERVVIKCEPSNSYTTCMWHNLLQCKIVYDRNGALAKAKEKYNIPYPPKLKEAILDRQMQLLDSAMPAYPLQIKKALLRGDMVSVNHRVTEFLASYFDLLFALNEKTHPGEKRLIQLCRETCSLLPKDFEENLASLFSHMFAEGEQQLKALDDIAHIVKNLKALLNDK